MKSAGLKKLFFITTAVLLTAGAAAGEKSLAMKKNTPKSLVIMLDGVRSDALLAAATPFLDKLTAQKWHPEYRCFYSFCARPIPDAPTDSAPNHAAIATGVTAAKNLVTANGQIAKGNYQQYPSYLRRIAEKSGLPTLFCYLWNEDKALDDHKLVKRLQCPSDEKNCQEMLKILQSEDAPASALWFIDAPDLGGHRSGFYPYGALYLSALNRCAQYLEAAFNAIAARKDFDRENWLIIITSDHGGIESTHGPRGSQLETLPFIVVSQDVPAGHGSGMLSNYDCAAMVLQHHNSGQLPAGLDSRLPELQALDNSASPAILHETFDEPGISGISGAAESGFRLGFRNGALKIAASASKVKIDSKMQKNAANGSFSCAFYLYLEKDCPAGEIWQFGNLQLQYADNKIFLQCTKNGQKLRIGEFDCRRQMWQLAVITADCYGNITLGWGAADGFFYFASAAADWSATDDFMLLGGGFTGRIDELLFFDRTVPMMHFSKYYHTLRQGGSYDWQ